MSTQAIPPYIAAQAREINTCNRNQRLESLTARIIGFALVMFGTILSFMIFPPQGAATVSTALILLYVLIQFPNAFSGLHWRTNPSSLHIVHSSPVRGREFVPYPQTVGIPVVNPGARVVPGTRTANPPGPAIAVVNPGPRVVPGTRNNSPSLGGRVDVLHPQPGPQGVQPTRSPVGKRE